MRSSDVSLPYGIVPSTPNTIGCLTGFGKSLLKFELVARDTNDRVPLRSHVQFHFRERTSQGRQIENRQMPAPWAAAAEQGRWPLLMPSIDKGMPSQNGAGPTPAHLTFARVVALQIAGRWHFVETPDQALETLREKFDGPHGHSFQRALATCEAVFAGLVPVDGLRAAFTVAVMEAGYPFEVHDRDLALVERRVAAEAENALTDMFLHPDD